MTKETAEGYCRSGDALLKQGDAPQALEAFQAGLSASSNPYERGVLLYDIAVCQSRMGQNDASLATLAQAATTSRAVISSMHQGTDFPELRDTDGYKALLAKFRLPFRWFVFYTLVRLPLNIACLAIGILLCLAANPTGLVILLPLVALQVALFIGLKNFRSWGYSLNQFVLVLEGVATGGFLTWGWARAASQSPQIPPMSSGFHIAMFLSMVIGSVIWVGGNMRYFGRRQKYFK